ncbi:hypothetical protein OPV22_003897 [Ensete ventricosum]|uniref:Uncharacterized protein n=1 Tax=Ensete ventricosum TaxID=4639 RepID=A0AAV8S227_ENSVE|nr:hypothetical protein OPV22_003897 [Ensete ventricosum]
MYNIMQQYARKLDAHGVVEPSLLTDDRSHIPTFSGAELLVSDSEEFNAMGTLSNRSNLAGVWGIKREGC